MDISRDGSEADDSEGSIIGDDAAILEAAFAFGAGALELDAQVNQASQASLDNNSSATGDFFAAKAPPSLQNFLDESSNSHDFGRTSAARNMPFTTGKKNQKRQLSMGKAVNNVFRRRGVALMFQRRDSDEATPLKSHGGPTTKPMTNFRFSGDDKPEGAHGGTSANAKIKNVRKAPPSEPREYVPATKRFQQALQAMTTAQAVSGVPLSEFSLVSGESSDHSFGSDGGISLQSEDMGGDFLVDFPTSRQEFLEQREVAEQTEFDPLVRSANVEFPTIDETDQRRPWRRMKNAPKTFEMSFHDSISSFSYQDSDPRPSSPELQVWNRDQFGTAHESRDTTVKRIEEEGKEDDASNLSNYDDDDSVMTELLLAQAALGWNPDDLKTQPAESAPLWKAAGEAASPKHKQEFKMTPIMVEIKASIARKVASVRSTRQPNSNEIREDVNWNQESIKSEGEWNVRPRSRQLQRSMSFKVGLESSDKPILRRSISESEIQGVIAHGALVSNNSGSVNNNTTMHRKRRHQRHHRRRHRGSDVGDEGERRRRSKSRHRSRSQRRSKSRHRDDAERKDEGDIERGHRDRNRRHRSRSRHRDGEGYIGRGKDSNGSKSKEENEVETQQFNVRGQRVDRYPEDYKEEEMSLGSQGRNASFNRENIRGSRKDPGIERGNNLVFNAGGDDVSDDEALPTAILGEDTDEEDEAVDAFDTEKGLSPLASGTSTASEGLAKNNPAVMTQSLDNFRSVFKNNQKASKKETSFHGLWASGGYDSNSDESDISRLSQKSNRLAKVKVTLRTRGFGLKMQRICGPRIWAMKWKILAALVVLILVLAIAIPLASSGGKSVASNLPNSPTWSPTTAPTQDPPFLEIAAIFGLEADDAAGTSVSVSANGRFLAVGLPQVSSGPGEVQVFELQDSELFPYGQTILGDQKGDLFGYSVSISDDGQFVAIGSPNANKKLGFAVIFGFDKASASWVQRGERILSSDVDGYSGSAVSISGNGSRVAVGAPRANDLDGMTQIFQYNSFTKAWSRLGQRIMGSGSELNGFSLSLDKTGSTVAIGAVQAKSSIDMKGRVYVYQFVNSQWSLLGNYIAGKNLQGRSVSLSSNGQRLAIGSTGFDNDKGVDVGACDVFGYLGDWVQLGSTIEGQQGDERRGFAVSLSRNGQRIACGGPGASSVGIYQEENGDWGQMGSTLSVPDSNFGAAVALNGDGSILAIGSPDESIGGEAKVGGVRVFQY